MPDPKMPIHLEYLATRSGKCLILIFQNQKYLFNCFEGFQRHSIESKVKLSQINTVFLPTDMSIVPFIGTFLTIGDIGKNDLSIVTKHKDIFLSAKSFAERKNLKLKFYDEGYCDDFIECSTFDLHGFSNVYVKIKNIRGRFNHTLACQKEIPKKEWKYLCEGKQITLNGDTYNGRDFLEPDKIFDEMCIIYNYNLEEEDILNIKNCKVYVCFHVNACKTLLKYRSGLFYVLNDMMHVEYKTLYKVQNELNAIYENFFRTQSNNIKEILDTTNDMLNDPKHDQSVIIEESTNVKKIKKTDSTVIHLDSCDIITINPQGIENELEKAEQVGYETFAENSVPRKSCHTHKLPGEEKNTCTTVCNSQTSDGIYFLGTGSAIPSKYRNVSSILVIKEQKGIFLDCGEDSLFSVHRLFGSYDILKIVETIVISHSHPDHHLGAISLIRKIFEMRRNINVIGPKITCDFIKQFCSSNVNYYTTELLKRPQTYYNSHLFELNEYTISFNFGYIVTLCPVNHTADSCGIKLDYENFSLTYSGDCRPSSLFEKLSENVDLIIHEATFADELQANALKTKHCTISEAINVYKRSKGKKLILTHFSQRYPKKIEVKNVICAFDFFKYDFDNHCEHKMEQAMDYLSNL